MTLEAITVSLSPTFSVPPPNPFSDRIPEPRLSPCVHRDLTRPSDLITDTIVDIFIHESSFYARQ